MQVTPPCPECGLPVVKLKVGRRKTRLHGYLRCVATACWDSATAIIGDVPLCGQHQRAVASQLGLASEDDVQRTEVRSFVYYLTWPERDLIKIGTSQSLQRRLKTLARPEGRPRLLVVEPGGYKVEHRRHAEFASLRTPGTELFRPAPVLLDHIANLDRKCPHWRGMAEVGHDWD